VKSLVEIQNSATQHARSCTLCGNRCSVNRAEDVTICGASQQMEVSYFGIHHGEEPPISGKSGCGSFFFHHCGLSCVFCQNWQISNEDSVEPRAMTANELTYEMLRFQEAGVASIGLVSPTPHITTIAEALYGARLTGLSVPVVYNSNGFDSVAGLRLLEGLVDVYLPDMKYASNEPAQVFSGVSNYVDTNRAAVLEMFRQAGPTVIGSDGIIRSGLIVRHLVLPGGHSDTVEVLQWIARHLPESVYLSLMAQYAPAYQVQSGFFPELACAITQKQYDFFLEVAQELGIKNILTQDLKSVNSYAPDFERVNPFQK
jgi:putative pyruvate formate lyase activating enzyme